MKRFVVGCVVVLALMSLAACGGGGGGRQDTPIATTRTLKISVAGTTSLIAEIELLVSLPPGVTVRSDAAGNVLDSVLFPSGTALSGALAAGDYTPATPAMRGNVRIGVISANGFAAGEFLTLLCDIDSGGNPQSSDFILSLIDVADTQNPPVFLNGLSLTALLGG